MASNMIVRDIMTKNPRVVREDTNMHEVIATIGKFDINSLIVVQNDKPVGILTTRDVLVRGFEHGLPPSSITLEWLLQAQ